MLMLDSLPELIRKVDKLKERKSQTEGALNQLLKRLKKEFGCNSLEKAKVKLKQKGRLERKMARIYTKKKMKLEKEFKDVL
jgi:hypothetical protein